MKFEELCKLLLEDSKSKTGKAKNRGGRTLHTVGEREGPAGMSSSSPGFGGTQYEKDPKKDAYFAAGKDTVTVDPDTGEKKKRVSGYIDQKKMTSQLFNAVKILIVDPSFRNVLKRISDSFERRTSQTISIEEERNFNNWTKADQTLAKRLDEEKAKVDHFRSLLEYDNYSDEDKNEIKANIKYLESMISEKDKEIKTFKPTNIGLQKQTLEKRKDAINSKLQAAQEKLTYYTTSDNDKDKLNDEIQNYESELANIESALKKKSTLSLDDLKFEREELEAELENLRMTLQDLSTIVGKDKDGHPKTRRDEVIETLEKHKAKYAMIKDQYEENSENLKDLTEHLGAIQAAYEQASNIAIDAIKVQSVAAAEKISRSLPKVDSVANADLANTDFDSLQNVDEKTKFERLECLKSTDPSINPIFKYAELFADQYYEFEVDENGELVLDAEGNPVVSTDEQGNPIRKKNLESREFDANINITKQNDLLRVPAMRMLKIMTGAEHSLVKSQGETFNVNKLKHIGPTIMHGATNDKAQLGITKALQDIKTEADWENENTQKWLLSQIDLLAIPDDEKQQLKDYVEFQTWGTTRQGNTAQVLLAKMNSFVKSLSESYNLFDNTFSEILESFEFDSDDYEIDMMEILEKKRKG